LGYKVRLAWIPSHTGSIAPNDLVDKRANDARHHGVSVSCPAPRAHTASLLKRASERECADRRQRRVVQDHIAAGPKLAGLPDRVWSSGMKDTTEDTCTVSAEPRTHI
ncbi:hypothetical protein FOZ62_008069, partial [Perkinsus olseni]